MKAFFCKAALCCRFFTTDLILKEFFGHELKSLVLIACFDVLTGKWSCNIGLIYIYEIYQYIQYISVYFFFFSCIFCCCCTIVLSETQFQSSVCPVHKNMRNSGVTSKEPDNDTFSTLLYNRCCVLPSILLSVSKNTLYCTLQFINK